jgi:hypothetical protein
VSAPVDAKLCDVTREADVQALVHAAIATMGRVDIAGEQRRPRQFGGGDRGVTDEPSGQSAGCR